MRREGREHPGLDFGVGAGARRSLCPVHDRAIAAVKRPQRRSRQKKKAMLTPAGAIGEDELERMAERVGYSPSPYHKSDLSVARSSVPRPDKTVCDGSASIDCRDATGLLKAGILRGMISTRIRQGWPQNVWAVDGEGIVHEAQLGNSGLGEYHGYPMKADDNFTRVVRKEWEERR